MASNENEILDPAAPVGNTREIAAGRALNRRHFLAALGMTGAAAGAGMMSGCSTSNSVAVTTSATTSQIGLLNLALNIKYLQATFYSFVAKGTDLTGAAVTSSGAITNAPAAITFATQQITDAVNEIYYDEKNHVTTLLGLLGSAAVFRPAINFAAFGTIIATNALSIARLLEDVGISAYAGIIPNLSSSDITVVGQVMGADSYHSGLLRLASIQNAAAYLKADSLDVAPFDPGTAALAYAGPTSSGGFFATAGASTTNLSTPAGFTFTRTTSQALAVLYGSGNATASNSSVTLATSGTASGGFFPNGVNGTVNKV